MVFHRSHDDQPVQPAPQSQSQPQPLDFDQPTDRDIRRLYARLRPDQRTAIGGEFMRLFRLSGDPAAQQYDKPIQGMLPANQVAEMHIFARDHLPQVLAEVREHPVTREALAHPGEEVEPVETEEAIIQEPIAVEDQETVAETGGVRSGAFMAEVGADRTDDLLSQPHNLTHTPEGETTGGTGILESAQREGPETNPADHGG